MATNIEKLLWWGNVSYVEYIPDHCKTEEKRKRPHDDETFGNKWKWDESVLVFVWSFME